MENVTSPQLVYNNTFDSANSTKINDHILIPYFTLYSDKLVIHPKPFNAIVKRKISPKSIKNLEKPKYTGKLSVTKKRIIKQKLTAWLSSIIKYNERNYNKFERKENYPVFITLTLASNQCHSDNEIKRRILGLFIKRLKQSFGISYYFWRAESQSNGNIHFHLIVDKYCSYYELLKIWNQVQNLLGYVDAFENVHGHKNPNSVDVKGVKDVGNFIDYVLKYCMKDEKNRFITGRIYGMSEELRNITIYQDVLDSELSNYIKDAIEYNTVSIYKETYFTVLYFKPEFYTSKFYKLLQGISEKYYVQLYASLYLKELGIIQVKKMFKEKLIKKEIQLELFNLSEQIKVINHYNYINSKSIKIKN